MSVLCYRIGEFKVGRTHPVSVTVHTYTAPPSVARPDTLLRLISRSVTALSETNPGMYRCAGTTQAEAGQLLAAHLAPTVTIAGLADLAVCLDWYRIPPSEGREGWTDSEIGRLVRAAKYGVGRPQAEARETLAARCIEFVSAHPVMRRADLVLAMPGSGVGPAPVGAIAQLLADALGRALGMAQDASLLRFRRAERPQKELRRAGAQADGNQAGTMRASDVDGRTVLLLDDTMAHGSSVREACRALGAAGASRVYSLTMAKDASGRRGYDFDLAPDHR